MTTYMRIKEFLKEYPMSRSSLYRLNATGALPITKFGRSSRIAYVDIQAWEATLDKFCGNAANDNA
jgi:predicted DNA-binding transcriptional regulator AlpA